MGHPLIDEFCRVPGVGACQSHFFNRCQRVFRDEVQPRLDQADRLEEENAALKAQVAELAAPRPQPKAKPQAVTVEAAQ